MTRKELQDRIPVTGYVLGIAGTRRISKDLLPYIQSYDEEILDIFAAKRNAAVSKILDTIWARYFKSYIVITNRQMIYIESMWPYKKVIVMNNTANGGQVIDNTGLQKIVYPKLLLVNDGIKSHRIATNKDIEKYVNNSAQQRQQPSPKLQQPEMYQFQQPQQMSISSLTNQSQSMPASQPIASTHSNSAQTVSNEKNFCTNCGNQLDAGWACCPRCGQKIVDFSETLRNSQSMPQMQREEVKEAHSQQIILHGNKGYLFGRKIQTIVTAEKGSFTIDANSVGRHSQNHTSFLTKDITKFKIKRQILDGIFEILLMGFLAFIVSALVTRWIIFDGIHTPLEFISILNVFVGISLCLVFFAVYCVTGWGRMMVIDFKDGNQLSIYINQESEAISFLNIVGYPYYRMNELKHKSFMPNKAWTKKKRISEWSSLIIGIALACATIYGLTFEAEIWEVQSYYYENEGREGTIEDVVENYLDGGEWVYWTKNGYILVDYVAEEDGFAISFRRTQNGLEVVCVEIDGEKFTDKDTCNDFIEAMTELYFE